MAHGEIRNKGQLTIPADVREAANLEVGAMVEFDVTEQGILLRPKTLVDADDAWFWSKDWQEGEREAQAEMAAGGRVFETHDDFIEHLDGLE